MNLVFNSLHNFDGRKSNQSHRNYHESNQSNYHERAIQGAYDIFNSFEKLKEPIGYHWLHSDSAFHERCSKYPNKSQM